MHMHIIFQSKSLNNKEIPLYMTDIVCCFFTSDVSTKVSLFKKKSDKNEKESSVNDSLKHDVAQACNIWLF